MFMILIVIMKTYTCWYTVLVNSNMTNNNNGWQNAALKSGWAIGWASQLSTKKKEKTKKKTKKTLSSLKVLTKYIRWLHVIGDRHLHLNDRCSINLSLLAGCWVFPADFTGLVEVVWFDLPNIVTNKHLQAGTVYLSQKLKAGIWSTLKLSSLKV